MSWVLGYRPFYSSIEWGIFSYLSHKVVRSNEIMWQHHKIYLFFLATQSQEDGKLAWGTISETATDNSLLNNYKEKQYFLLKAIEQNTEQITLCSLFFIVFISLPSLQPEHRRRTGRSMGVRRYRFRSHFTIYSL